jgi:radical SAM protein with 4Fe4S-binding SPASM domain
MDVFALSKQNQTALEITVKVGCGRMCDYCPQELFIESFKTKALSPSRTLSLLDLQGYIKNVPNSTLLKWTGFTEPLDAREFPKMVEFLHLSGFEQTISTTLCGNKNSIEYFIMNISKFKYITLHLPDDQGLMKGKFNYNYSVLLKEFIRNYISEKNKPQVDFFLIGNNWHDSIRDIIELNVQNGTFNDENVIKAKYLNTRAGSISVKEFGLKVSGAPTTKRGKYYCSYQRLNQGVLTPDGSVVLCCQDYGMVHTIGSLKESKLDDIYNSIESNAELKSSFENGTFSPCTNCEHYQTISSPLTTNRKV